MSPTGAKYDGRCLPTLRWRGLIGRDFANASFACSLACFLATRSGGSAGVDTGGGGSFFAVEAVETTARDAAIVGKCDGRCFPTFLLLGERNTELKPLRLARRCWRNPAIELELALVLSAGSDNGSESTDLGLRLCGAPGENAALLLCDGTTWSALTLLGAELMDGDQSDGAAFATLPSSSHAGKVPRCSIRAARLSLVRDAMATAAV